MADAFRDKHDKLGALMDASREDVLTYTDYPKDHWARIASTNPLERVNKMGYPGRLAPGGPIPATA